MAGGDGFQLIIYVTIDNIRRTLYLDTCMEKRINASATIPTQPLQNGDTVSDHMYRNPDEFSINGTFSEFGRYENDPNNVHGFYNEYNRIAGKGIDKVTAVQTVFERIKNEGLLCDLTTIERGANGNYRFKIRKNMALQSITWTELQVSLKYSFTFKEIMSVNIQEYKAEIDSDLPNIYLPETKSLGMLMTEEAKRGEANPIIVIVMKALLESGAISKVDAEFIVKHGNESMSDNDLKKYKDTFQFEQFFKTVFYLTPDFKFDFLKFSSLLMPFGTLIHDIITATNYSKSVSNSLATYKLVSDLSPYIENGELNLEKAIICGADINKNEADRLMSFLNDLKNITNSITTNVAVYDIATSIEDNSDREVVLSVGNNPYYITFSRINGEYSNWNIQIKGLSSNGYPIDLNGLNGTRVTQNKLCTTLEDMCDKNNALFWDSTGNYQVYLYKSGNQSITTTSFSGKKTSILAPERFLCNLNLLVVKGNFRDEMQKIYDRIYSELSKAGYN